MRKCRKTCYMNTSFIPITLDNARWVGGVTKKFRKINVTQADTS